MRVRRGATLLEQILLLSLLSACATVAVASGVRVLDTVTVHGVGREISELFALARDRAMATGVRTAIRFDVTAQRIIVHAGTDTLARLSLVSRGVTVSATRDSMAYVPSGLGFGAANLRLLLSRGASTDTITVSRLGRVKR
jgi:Tfp pilus assembly protein FimT